MKQLVRAVRSGDEQVVSDQRQALLELRPADESAGSHGSSETNAGLKGRSAKQPPCRKATTGHAADIDARNAAPMSSQPRASAASVLVVILLR